VIAASVLPARPRRDGDARAAGQRRFYAEQGYLVIPELLGRRTLARLRSALADVLRGARRVTRSTDKFLVVKGPAEGYHVTRVRDPIKHHQDNPAYPHTKFDLLIVTVPLDDATPANGCLTVIPGSHRLGPLPHRFIFEGAARTQLADPRVAADRAHWLQTPVPAGGIEVHHGNLLHSSAVNRTDGPRTTLQLWYRAADNVQVGGARDFYGWGLQVRGVDPGTVRMAEGTCKLPGGAAIRPEDRVAPPRRAAARRGRR